MARNLAGRWGRAGVCVSAATVLACTGAIEDTLPRGPGASGGQNGMQPGPAVSSPDTRLRLLTRTEYLNTLRDLLFVGDTSAAANVLPAAGTLEGFDNDAENLKIDDLAIDRYDIAATSVLENALDPAGASRKKIVKCDLAKSGVACARTTVSAFARRAWRRPLENDEVDGLMTALSDVRGGTIEEGLRLALRAVLASPNFLYRVEIDPPGASGRHPLDPHELATRLSYFVWSSTPDDPLLGRADDGSLAEPGVFAAELDRMLKDPKAAAVVDNFAAQLMNTRAINGISPDAKIFPSFDEDLRKAMIAESQLFFRAFLDGDRSSHSLVDMLDAGFTFANARLAKHYNLSGVRGTSMQEVPVTGTQRFGILSQASILTVTSSPSRTSPTRRGKWVLKRLLCSPPPEPDKIPPLNDKAPNLPPNPTVRQLMEAHVKEDRCKVCHQVMDPLGFSLEHYDGIGAWRDRYPNNAIDARGALPSGETFDGAFELSALLKKDPRFVSCFTKNVFSYALGRGANSAGDQAAIGALATVLAAKGGSVKDLLSLVATSQAFQSRGGQQP